MMLTQFARNWWVVVLRGVLAVIFGLLALWWPGLTIDVLILMFGAYALVDGLFAVVAAFSNSGAGQRWWLFFEGLAGVVAGAFAFVWPGLTAIALLFVIATWAIVTGVFEIAAAIELRREISGEWLYIVSGILSVLFGLFVVIFPGAGALSVIWLISFYAWLFGLLLIVLGFQMRGWGDQTHGAQTTVGHGI